MEISRMKSFMPYMMAEGTAAGGEPTPEPTQPQQAAAQQNTPEIDYNKLGDIIAGKQKVAEETVLKNYFKQQGLSGEQMNTAINDYKAKVAEAKPDVNALNQQIAAATQERNAALIQVQAFQMAGEIGVDLKTMPYVIKMANMNDVIADGAINSEKLKESLMQVLEDIPQLKIAAANTSGFKEIGGNNSNNVAKDDAALRRAFGLK